MKAYRIDIMIDTFDGKGKCIHCLEFVGDLETNPEDQVRKFFASLNPTNPDID